MPAIQVELSGTKGEIRFDWKIESDQTVARYSVHGFDARLAKSIRFQLDRNIYEHVQIGGSRPDNVWRFYETFVQTLESMGKVIEIPVDVGVIRDPEMVR